MGYKHYIKIDENFNIVDYFCEVQQYKLDGSEIFYRDNQKRQANLDLINENTYYWKYYYNSNTKEILEKTPEMDFEIYRNLKKREIRLAFENSFREAVFYSETLKIDVDCRRADTKHDMENVKILINEMTRENIKETLYKGHSEYATVTIEDLDNLIIEMEKYGLLLYQTKQIAEEQIKNAKTIEDLKVITWSI